MSDSIHNPAVYRNINRLRDLIGDAHFKGDRVSVLIDCETGEFSVPQAIGELEARMHQAKKTSRQFKYAELWIRSIDGGQVVFEWSDPDWDSSLTHAAAGVLSETLSAVNRCGRMVQSGSAKEALLECVRSLKREMPEEILQHSAWAGSIERIPAEKILGKAAPGTYLLRTGDEYTRVIEGNLAAQDSFPVRCFVLTLAGPCGKISDKILIQRPNGWAVFNDDLLLSDYRFKPLAEVIAACGGVKPLSLKRAA